RPLREEPGEEFQAAMVRVQKDTLEVHKASSASTVKEMKCTLRRELQNLFGPVLCTMRSHAQRLEEAISIVKAEEPETDDTQKFFADVLAELENARKDCESSTSAPVDRGSERKKPKPVDRLKWYHDPITWEMMNDPVKASDGHTYDRSTLLDHTTPMSRSPFGRGKDDQLLYILVSDLDVRSRLFEKFPDQELLCNATRSNYREQALKKASQGLYGEALAMLNHVLAWAEDDQECRAKRDEMQTHLFSKPVDVDILRETLPKPWLPVEKTEWKSELDLESILEMINDESDSRSSGSESVSGDFDGLHSPATLADIHDPGIVTISEDCLTVKLLKQFMGAVPVPASQPCSNLAAAFYYFEMKVVNVGKRGRIAIGFSLGRWDNETLNLVGHEKGAWGYHGECGRIYHEGEAVPNFHGRKYSKGDIVGAGFFYESRQIFFTYNGKLIAGAVGVLPNVSVNILWPVIGLKSKGAEVTVNFGQREFMLESTLPTKLMEYTGPFSDLVSISPDGLEAQQNKPKKKQKHYVVSLQSDQPTPCPEWLYYFEITIKNSSRKGAITLGFTDRKCAYPEWEPKIWGFNEESASPVEGEKCPFEIGDVVGAGIHHGTNELFLVKNGKLLKTVPNGLIGLEAYPTISLEDLDCNIWKVWRRGENIRVNTVSVNFGQVEFKPELRPSRFNIPQHRASSSNQLVLSMQADMPAPIMSSFYFELNVTDISSTIGFATAKDFQGNQHPGMYTQSCGYHDGKLMAGGEDEMAEVPRLCIGDTVGAGLVPTINLLYFTHNGQRVFAMRCNNVFKCCSLYPTIGISHTYHGEIRANFGELPFVYNTVNAGVFDTTGVAEESSGENTMVITVRTETLGDRCLSVVARSHTIEYIKKLIFPEFPIPPSLHVLLYKGEVLDDELTLNYYLIEGGSTLHHNFL
ncbi:hypothetical protein M758_4G163900, partial [Ceratodon purpureus]